VLLAPGDLGRGERSRDGGAPEAPRRSLASASSTVTDTSSASARVSPTGLGELLQEGTLAATRGDALAVLLGLWGVQAASGGLDCGRLPREGLECLATVGTWRKLRRLDLPAALELVGPTGERRYAALTGMTATAATLRFGDRVVTLPVADVEPYWEGFFVILWRPPPGPLPVGPGARGPTADWLRERLAHADGGLPAERGQPFDEALRLRVVAFQQARSLEPHGVVDRETAILLQTTDNAPDVPRLSAGSP